MTMLWYSHAIFQPNISVLPLHSRTVFFRWIPGFEDLQKTYLGLSFIKS